MGELPSVALMSLLPLLLRGATAPLAGRPQHSLDGPWSFVLMGAGEDGAEPGWASPQPPAGAFFGSIAVPGTWGAQGWGEPWVCTHDGPAGTWNPCATPLPTPTTVCLHPPAASTAVVQVLRPGQHGPAPPPGQRFLPQERHPPAGDGARPRQQAVRRLRGRLACTALLGGWRPSGRRRVEDRAEFGARV